MKTFCCIPNPISSVVIKETDKIVSTYVSEQALILFEHIKNLILCYTGFDFMEIFKYLVILTLVCWFINWYCEICKFIKCIPRLIKRLLCHKKPCHSSSSSSSKCHKHSSDSSDCYTYSVTCSESCSESSETVCPKPCPKPKPPCHKSSSIKNCSSFSFTCTE